MKNISIDAEHIYKNYGSTMAVNDLSFSVPSSSCCGLLGPNGAGKSTMMKIIYGKARRDYHCETRLKVMGYDPEGDELSVKFLSGVVPQDNNLDEELTVLQNLSIFMRFYGKTPDQKRIHELLSFMELSEKAQSKIKELSGGMKRRLVIARALLNNPRLLILDEPTTGLDPQVRHMIWDKIRTLKKQGMTVLLTTHYMEEAFQICDSIIIMHSGKSLLSGPPKTLVAGHLERFVLEISGEEHRQNMVKKLGKKKCRIDQQHGICMFYSDDQKLLRRAAFGLSAGEFYLRETNLEDLFLKTTGMMLNEKQ
ncbi:MAG: ABC transporter [Spirochaetes bacterium GWF1_41_5]|nr:MAG: ABC transporter [Spirochaetes bacterium GWF1_41_5]